MRSLTDITQDEYKEVLQVLGALGKTYTEKVNEATGSDIEGDVLCYVNLYFKLLEHLGHFQGKRIIEIGSGPGYFLDVLRQMGAQVYAVDLKDFSALAESNGIRFYAGDVLDLPDRASPADIFPEARFSEFDALITRLFLEPHGLQNSKKAEIVLKKLRQLSPIHIHETSPFVGFLNREDINLHTLGYRLISKGQSPFGMYNEVHVLGRQI